jgi:DNA-binding CsgD family transcriptional regulator/PAS domain-containing protein
MDTAQVSRCISSLYDTVLDASRWDVAIRDLAGLFEASSADLFEYDFVLARPSNFRRLGQDDEVERRYATYYHRLDPATGIAIASRVGQWLADEQMLDLTAPTHREYIHDFALRSNIGRVAGVKVIGDAQHCLFLSLQRAPGAERFGDAGAHMYRMIEPHLRGVARIRARLDDLSAGERIARAALDRLQFGVLVCTATGRVVMANAVAEHRICRETGLFLRNQELVAVEPAEHDAIRRALAQACTLENPHGCALRMGSDGRGTALSVVVLPIPANHELQAASQVPLALVGVSATGLHPTAPDLLQMMFRLTSAETSLVLALLEGTSISEFALQRGVRVSTVRSQLRSVLEKTGCATQAAVVNLARSVPPVH